MARPSGFARARVIDAALELFVAHGVHGTSLQMIADRLGVGKAAVYYQFKSKDEIVVAVVQPILDDTEHLARIAELLPDAETRRDVAVRGLVEMVIRHRRVASMFYGDPVVHHIVEAHDEYRAVIDRFAAVLLGANPEVTIRVAISMVSAGVYACATDPRLADVDDATLRQILLDCASACLSGLCSAADGAVPDAVTCSVSLG